MRRARLRRARLRRARLRHARLRRPGLRCPDPGRPGPSRGAVAGPGTSPRAGPCDSPPRSPPGSPPVSSCPPPGFPVQASPPAPPVSVPPRLPTRRCVLCPFRSVLSLPASFIPRAPRANPGPPSPVRAACPVDGRVCGMPESGSGRPDPLGSPNRRQVTGWAPTAAAAWPPPGSAGCSARPGRRRRPAG
ncbi:hypothetical protein [Kitasatospora sp. LaBMicrA B282]|uniref:hypothetical protein n=1 Tax=Kitasatospora sp. LaBMicrA B282 TaxID=3420949 RepID=UPI003D132CE6